MTTESREEAKETANQASQVDGLARHYRHIGFAIFGGVALLLSAILLYSALTGLNRGEVYDPFTGEKVSQP